MSTDYHSYETKSIEKVSQLGYARGNMHIQTMTDAIEYLDQFIQPPGGLGDGAHNFGRMQELMKHLGDPQNKLKVIHIAGTSGKGSTAVAISSLLHAHGFKVGLTVSPHMLDLRERTQVDNRMISEEKYCQNLVEMIPAIDAMKKSKYGSPSFFEITMAHAFYTFYKKKVDYAVIETGMGGRYDASNVVDRNDKLVLLTRIGLDHTEFLGNTIAKIAEEKAHIIQKENRVFSVPQEPEAQEVIKRISLQKKATLKIIDIQKTLITSLEGEYQKENVSLAIAGFYYLSKRDHFHYDHHIVTTALQTLHFLGRFDIRKIEGKTVILDGAHNPQKMEAFITSLCQKYPDEKFDFLVAFRKGKDFSEMLHYIIPHAHSIIITEFGMNDQGMHTQAESITSIERVMQEQNFSRYMSVSPASKALSQLLKEKNKKIVVSGSLYLLSELYLYINKTN